MAFSPGEYFDDMKAVARAAAKVRVPIYVTSAPDAGEVSDAKAILAASPARSKPSTYRNSACMAPQR
jgi:hypothetical protein